MVWHCLRPFSNDFGISCISPLQATWAMQHLDLKPFTKTHMGLAGDIATVAAFTMDHGMKIVETLIAELH